MTGMDTRPPLLELRSVSKHFGGVLALVDVDLTVRAGEVVALVGDNAAGKSTVARMVSGVYQPDGGQVLLDGRPVTIASAQAAFALGIAANISRQMRGDTARFLPPGHSSCVKNIGQFSIATRTPLSSANLMRSGQTLAKSFMFSETLRNWFLPMKVLTV